MNKKGLVWFGIVLAVFVIAAVYTIHISQKIFDNNNDGYEVDGEEYVNDKYIETVLDAGEFIIADYIEGVVEFEESAIVEFEVSDKDKTEVKVHVGDKVKKNDIIYTCGDESVVASIDGEIIQIDKKDTIVIKLLDFKKSKIVVDVDQIRQTKINKNTKIQGAYNKSSGVELELLSVNPTIEEGKFRIELKNEFDVYENTKINVYIEYEKRENVLAVSKEYIKQDSNGKNYIMLIDDEGNVSNYYVSIGERSGDYYEILDAEELEGKKAVFDMKEKEINGLE